MENKISKIEVDGRHIFLHLEPSKFPKEIYFDEIWVVRKELQSELYKFIVNKYQLNEKLRNKVRYRVLINEKPLSIIVDFMMPFKVGD